jgi:hypothetical protein
MEALKATNVLSVIYAACLDMSLDMPPFPPW